MVKRKLFSSALFSAVLLFSTSNKATPILPKILDGSILEEIRHNKGQYKSNGKIYTIWAFREGTEELGALSQCPFLDLPELQSYKAARILKLLLHIEDYTLEHEMDSSTFEVPLEVRCISTVVEHRKAAPSPLPVSCGVETANPLLNPEVQAIFGEEEDTKPKMRHSSVTACRKLLVYRLHNPKGQAVKDFLLIYLGKGSASNPGYFDELKKTCTDQLQKATILSSPLE